MSFALEACDNTTPAAEPEESKTGAAAPASPRDFTPYGDGVKGEVNADLAKVLANPAAFEEKQVVVEGTVRRACTRKGCWMELAPSDSKAAPGCRVTFKDYAFFVPTDSAGAQARVQGTVEVERVKASHVEHLESEGAHFASKNPDGSANEVRLVATGVELKKS